MFKLNTLAIVFGAVAIGYSWPALGDGCTGLMPDVQDGNAQCSERIGSVDGDLDVEVKTTITYKQDLKHLENGRPVSGDAWMLDMECIGNTADCETLGVNFDPYISTPERLESAVADIQTKLREAQTNVNKVSFCEAKDGLALADGSPAKVECLIGRLAAAKDPAYAYELYRNQILPALQALLDSTDPKIKAEGDRLLAALVTKVSSRAELTDVSSSIQTFLFPVQEYNKGRAAFAKLLKDSQGKAGFDELRQRYLQFERDYYEKLSGLGYKNLGVSRDQMTEEQKALLEKDFNAPLASADEDNGGDDPATQTDSPEETEDLKDADFSDSGTRGYKAPEGDSGSQKPSSRVKADPTVNFPELNELTAPQKPAGNTKNKLMPAFDEAPPADILG